jgi:maleate isomerase/arylmalonate decarboxylase
VTPLNTLTDFMEAKAGIPCVATAPDDALNAHEQAFFEECGIEIVKVKGLGIGAGGPHEYVKIAKVPKEQVYAHCRAANAREAHGMIVSCTDFPALEAIPRLEAELGKPVVSSNLATFWAALRAAGVRQPIAGFGRLLEAQR